MIATGFEEVRVQHRIWPISRWNEEPSYQELGYLAGEHVHLGLENWAMRRFTRDVSLEREDVIVLCAEVRQELREPGVHAIQEVKVVYGVKPHRCPERQSQGPVVMSDGGSGGTEPFPTEPNPWL